MVLELNEDQYCHNGFNARSCQFYRLCLFQIPLQRTEKWADALLLLQMIPQFSALIAIFVLAQMLGLINSHLALILIYAGGQIPMNTYLMKGYLDAIPKDLDESARMDGAGHFRIFIQIIMPLAKPILAVVAINSFTGPLGDFIISSVIVRSPEMYTLPIGLYNLVSDKMGASYTTFAAGALLIAIPVALLFLVLQKQFVSGLTQGGTKG